MNVDKLMKVNVLANTLKEHGLAASREDAASLADSMVCGKTDDNLAKIFAQAEAIKPEEVPKVQQNTAMDEDSVRAILQSFADQFCGEVNRLTQKIDRLEDDLARHARKSQEPAQAKKEESAPEEPRQQASPRSGSYDSQDVSIEKFFYCGNR